MFEFPPLDTTRLYLRTLEPGDLNFLYTHFSQPQVNRYLLDAEPVSRLEQAQEILDFFMHPLNATYNRWLISKAGGKPIGTCGYHKWDTRNRRVEIGYDLSPAHWNEGYMTEALESVLKYGFETMHLHRVEALVHPENRASLRVVERLGFRQEGLLRNYFYQNGQYHDHWILSLLEQDRPKPAVSEP